MSQQLPTKEIRSHLVQIRASWMTANDIGETLLSRIAMIAMVVTEIDSGEDFSIHGFVVCRNKM